MEQSASGSRASKVGCGGNLWLWAGGAAVGWVLVGVGLPLLLYGKMPNTAEGFGNMFGAANALFAGLAFAGIIFTLKLQQQEIESNQQQLRAQEKRLDEQTRIQAEQVRIQGEQVRIQGEMSGTTSRLRFEGTLQHMTEALIRAIDRAGNDRVQGPKAFENFALNICSLPKSAGSTRLASAINACRNHVLEQQGNQPFRQPFHLLANLLDFVVHRFESSDHDKDPERHSAARERYLRNLFCQIPAEVLWCLFLYLEAGRSDAFPDPLLGDRHRDLIYQHDLLRYCYKLDGLNSTAVEELRKICRDRQAALVNPAPRT